MLFGCLLFVALPAAIFKHIEGWSALESLYFVVITLTTIGFGDFVAGMNTRVRDSAPPGRTCMSLCIMPACLMRCILLDV